MSAVQPEQVREAVEGLNYPASKDDVVGYASSRDIDESVVRALRALPVAIYENRRDLMASVPFDQGVVGEGQDTEDRMNERRRHTHSGLAEHEKQAPQSPVEEGLGYNRGS